MLAEGLTEKMPRAYPLYGLKGKIALHMIN